MNLIAPGGGLGADSDSLDEQDDVETTDATDSEEQTDHSEIHEDSEATGESSGDSEDATDSVISISYSSESSTSAAWLPTLNILDDFFRPNSSLVELRSGARHSSIPRSGFANQVRRLPDLLPVVQEFIPAPLQDLTHAILNNHSMWNELNTIRHQMEDQHQSSIFAENIVVGTTTAVTGGLTVGYVIWLIRGGSLLATMVSVIPSWASFDPLPVMDRFEEEKSVEDKESLASIVSGI